TSYDFGARLFDARVGRWLSIDPLSKEYADMTPYSSFANNPVIFIDPDGQIIKLTPSLSTTERMKVFGAIQKLTNDKLVMVAQKDGSYLINVQKSASSRTQSLPIGTKLVNDLVINSGTVEINMFMI